MHSASVPEGQIIAPELFCALIQKKRSLGFLACILYIFSHTFSTEKQQYERESVCGADHFIQFLKDNKYPESIQNQNISLNHNLKRISFLPSFSASIFNQVLKPLLQASRCYFPSPQRAGLQPESCLKSIQTQLLLVAQLIRYQLTIKRKDFEVGYGNHKLDRMSML